MKHKLIILITLLSVSLYAQAQEYRLAKSTGTLKLNITAVIVEGYDGKEIIFSGQKVETEELDERAKGLVPITSSKHVDNTGLGISVTESGQDVNVNLVTKKPIGVLTIKVPNNIKVSIHNNNSQFNFSASSNNLSFNTVVDEIVLKNLKSEIEVSVYSNKIRLENNTGPMNIKTVSGPIDAIFKSDIKGPVSIISVNNYVDVTLPASTKANIEMSSRAGKLYAGKEFKIDLELPVVTIDGVVQDENRSTARSTKARDTAAARKIVTTRINGQHIAELPKGTVQVQGLDKLKGTLVTTVDGIQLKGDTVQIAAGSFNFSNNLQFNENRIVTGFPSTYTIGSLYNGGDRIKGKLNGGGIDLIFKSTNKNVYLRQQ